MLQVGQLFSTRSTCLFSDTPQGGCKFDVGVPGLIRVWPGQVPAGSLACPFPGAPHPFAHGLSSVCKASKAGSPPCFSSLHPHHSP